MTMTHPGLPLEWSIFIIISMLLLAGRQLLMTPHNKMMSFSLSLAEIPVISRIVKFLTDSVWPLLFLKIVMVCLFLLVIMAGLIGTPIAERNIATVLTWNIWWAALIISVFFIGSAWCAVCPWDTLASWLVRRKLWGRAQPNNSLNLKVPRSLSNVWPAIIMLVSLTWLELGFGVTTNPYITSVLALLMVVMATVSLAIYDGKAFCRHFCPVGRTIGFYSQLAPVELRPIDPDICAKCTTLDCYHGSETIEPCPTHLVMGKLKQNTYCVSCGNCTQSCPDQNVAWRLRSHGKEAIQDARPHWDEAWFMLILLGLTGFHGITMMPFFESWLSKTAYYLQDSGQLLWSFTLLLFASMLLILLVYFAFILIMKTTSKTKLGVKTLFSEFAFASLPLAFAYHLAHNLNHLLRENSDLGALMANPFGIDAQPLTMIEKHTRHMEMLIPQDLLFALQAGLMVFGFWIALKIIQHRGNKLLQISNWQLSPMIIFISVITVFHIFLLSQPMIMRM